jgi:hypothetical protein
MCAWLACCLAVAHFPPSHLLGCRLAALQERFKWSEKEAAHVPSAEAPVKQQQHKQQPAAAAAAEAKPKAAAGGRKHKAAAQAEEEEAEEGEEEEAAAAPAAKRGKQAAAAAADKGTAGAGRRGKAAAAAVEEAAEEKEQPGAAKKARTGTAGKAAAPAAAAEASGDEEEEKEEQGGSGGGGSKNMDPARKGLGPALQVGKGGCVRLLVLLRCCCASFDCCRAFHSSIAGAADSHRTQNCCSICRARRWRFTFQRSASGSGGAAPAMLASEFQPQQFSRLSGAECWLLRFPSTAALPLQFRSSLCLPGCMPA